MLSVTCFPPKGLILQRPIYWRLLLALCYGTPTHHLRLTQCNPWIPPGPPHLVPSPATPFFISSIAPLAVCFENLKLDLRHTPRPHHCVSSCK
ncbi:hypothetical protein CRENBAI_010402 [Crenichthys baileyi]|uniref:Uncharacterized protein n=1 Tax=Crenichthys baileyi TaxID=28760 RepID=A0AAV9QSY0_9TELE